MAGYDSRVPLSLRDEIPSYDMRAADALPKEEALDEAFLRLYCSRVTDGVDRLHRWLSSIELRTSFQIEDVVTIRKRA